jgi:hypothetical protein
MAAELLWGSLRGFSMRGLVRYAAVTISALTLSVGMSSGAAQASTWVIDYTANNPGDMPYSAMLNVTASDMLNAASGYDITGIGGNVDGDPITALVANPHQATASASYSADGQFIFDNIIWPAGAPQLSNPGILFMGSSGHEYNIFSDDAVHYELYKATPFGGYNANSRGTISVTESFPASFDLRSPGVPEPASWALMILGFGAVGAVLRRRQARGAAVPA